jgi:hypothetical protein
MADYSRIGEELRMSQRSLPIQIVAAVLVVALQVPGLPTLASGEGAKLAGSILAFDEKAPVEGARLHAADPMTGRIYSSGSTGTDGKFEIGSLPSAAYELAVESDGHLFVVGAPVRLAPGQTQSVQVAIDPRIDPQVAPPPQSEEDRRTGTGVWDNPLTAALIIVGSAVVLGLIIDQAASDDDEPTASPSDN